MRYAKSPSKQLDEFLEYINQKEGGKKHNKSFEDIKKHFNLDVNDEPELRDILEELGCRNTIKFNEEAKTYYSTFAGKMKLESGGFFTENLKDKKLGFTRFILNIALIVAGVYYFLEVCKIIFNLYHEL